MDHIAYPGYLKYSREKVVSYDITRTDYLLPEKNFSQTDAFQYLKQSVNTPDDNLHSEAITTYFVAMWTQ